jgi:hypothetical protein
VSITRSKEGFRYLRVAWVVLVMAIISAAALGWSGYWYLGKEIRDDLTLKRQLGETQSRVNTARRERDDLLASSVMFAGLMRQGILQEESRLELIERLDRLNTRHRLLSLEYDFEPQRPLPAPGGRVFEAIEVLSSRVKVKVLAIHEGDLIAFLDELAKPPRGYNPIQSCRLRRLEAGMVMQANARVEAECTLEWVTLKDKRGTRAK